MERSTTTVEQLFLDFSMEKFNFSHHFRNAECEMWIMEYTVKAMELCSHFYVQIHMTAFKIISSFTFSPFLFPHQVWILEQLSTPLLCSERWKKYERHDAKTKGSNKSDGLAQKIRFSIAVSAAAFFSFIFLHSLVFMWKYTKDLIVQF